MSPSVRDPQSRSFSRGSWSEFQRIANILRRETVGGGLPLLPTVAALVRANSGRSDAYAALHDTTVGPAALRLDLDLGEWAANGLLVGVALRAGIGFTISLPIGELTFGAGTERDHHTKVAVLARSLPTAALAGRQVVERVQV